MPCSQRRDSGSLFIAKAQKEEQREGGCCGNGQRGAASRRAYCGQALAIRCMPWRVCARMYVRCRGAVHQTSARVQFGGPRHFIIIVVLFT